MSQYLTLCQRAIIEAGISDVFIPSVKKQTGLAGRMVNWVADAWSDLQTDQHWRFRRKTFSFTLTPGLSDYSLAALGWNDLSDLDTLKLAQRVVGAGGTVFPLRPLNTEEWRAKFVDQTILPAQPQYVMVDVSKDLVRYTPAPNIAFAVAHDYWRTPQILAENTDKPTGLIDDLHPIVMWRAVWYYGGLDVAEDVKRNARDRYRPLIRRMNRLYLPEITFDALPLDAKPGYTTALVQPK